MTVAFFDMDRTLVLCNSGREYARDLRLRGELGLRDLIRISTVAVGYKLSLVDMPRVMAEAVSRLEGQDEAAFRARCEALFEARVRPRISAEGAAIVRDHQRRGHHVVVISAQTPYFVRPLCRALEIDEWLASDLEIRDGRLTGALAGAPCYGEGKVVAARRWARARDADLSDAWFYTDSYSDLPLLEACRHRRVVNPDPRLSLHARRRGWPILRFRR